MHTVTPAPSTTDVAQALRPGQPALLRRYRQATTRARRHEQLYMEAVAARGDLLRELLDSGISYRRLAALTGLSKRRIEVLSQQRAPKVAS